jgi:hypothetical protein
VVDLTEIDVEEAMAEARSGQKPAAEAGFKRKAGFGG